MSPDFLIGIALYAINAFTPSQCHDALAVFEGLPRANLSVLWHGFGENDSCLREFLALPQPKTLAVHPFNGTCEHVGRHCSREPRWTRSARLGRLLDIRAELSQYLRDPAFVLIISLGLEERLRRSEALWLYSKTRTLFPRAKISRSTINEAAPVYPPDLDYVELHSVPFRTVRGKSRVLCNDGWGVSLDDSCSRPNCINYSAMPAAIEAARRRKDYFFVWWEDVQGYPIREASEIDPFVRPITVRRRSVDKIKGLLQGLV